MSVELTISRREPLLRLVCDDCAREQRFTPKTIGLRQTGLTMGWWSELKFSGWSVLPRFNQSDRLTVLCEECMKGVA